MLWSACMVLWLTSCATPNAAKQKKHWDKFIYYGGKVDTVTRTVTKEIIVKGKDGKDSLIYVDVPVKCPEPQIEYKDRWHIRHMAKAERDSMKHVENILKMLIKHKDRANKENTKQVKELTKQVKEATKKKRQERKTKSQPWKLAIVALGLVALIIILLRFR